MEGHYIYCQRGCYGFCCNVYSEKLNDRILFSLNATVETKTDSDALFDLFLRRQLQSEVLFHSEIH